VLLDGFEAQWDQPSKRQAPPNRRRWALEILDLAKQVTEAMNL